MIAYVGIRLAGGFAHPALQAIAVEMVDCPAQRSFGTGTNFLDAAAAAVRSGAEQGFSVPRHRTKILAQAPERRMESAVSHRESPDPMAHIRADFAKKSTQ
jgi:hypothetical protein